MSEYVPPEERAQREKEAADAAKAAGVEAQRVWVAKVENLLSQLDGRGTDYYLEILRSARGPRWLQRGKTIVTNAGWRGGPTFVISEVLDGYRVRNAIFSGSPKEPGGMSFDALIAPDGRMWSFRGAGVTENTYQLLASSSAQMGDRTQEDLERIADGLAEYLDRLPSE